MSRAYRIRQRALLTPREDAMSRAYRIRQRVSVQDSLQRDLSAEDEVCTELELLGVLPPEQMAELVRGALRQRGYQEGDGVLSRRNGGVTVAVDAASGEVTIRAEGTQTATVQGGKDTTVDGYLTDAQKQREQEVLRAALRQELERKMQQKEGEVQRKVSDELEAALGGIGAELDQVVNEVTRAALKIKAAQLGQVKEIAEDARSGSLTITVEV